MSRESRRKRAQHARETRGKFGGGGGSYVVSIPDLKSEDWFKIDTKGKNEIDIVEFRITQEWYPQLKCRGGGTCGDLGLVPGELDYKLEIPVHQRIGPNNKDHLCPLDAFGTPCPVCEEKFAKLEANGNKWDRDTMGPLNASWRDFYNVWNYATNRFEPWQVAYSSFEKLLQDAIDRTGDEMYPWAYDEGNTIEFLATEEPLGKGKTWSKPQIPTFFPRDPYPDETVDELPGFDKYIKISTYDEIAADHFGYESEPIQTSATKHQDAPKEEPTTRTRPRQGASPIEQTSRRRPASEKEAPWEHDNRCSFGHNFGADVNATPDCKDCKDEVFNECIEENDRIKKKEDSKPPPAPSTRRRSSPEPAPKTSRRRRKA